MNADETVVPDVVADRLRAQRRLMLTGRLDARAADRICAELMLADGVSADPVELIVNSQGGPADAALAIVDVIALMRAPVASRCIGSALGTAAVVLATGTGGRSATPNAALRLRIDDAHEIEGSAGDIDRTAGHLVGIVDRLAGHLDAVTGMGVQRAAEAIERGSYLSPTEALEIGLIDQVTPSQRADAVG